MTAVCVVAGVAAVCSFAHMQSLAAQHGEEWRSWLIPLSVDGMLVASTLAIVDRRRAGLPAGWVPWFGLALGILASLAANVAAAQPNPIARIIAAWPPVAFAVAVETLVIVLRGTAVGVSDRKFGPEFDTEPPSVPETPDRTSHHERVTSPGPRGMDVPRAPRKPARATTRAVPADLVSATRARMPIGRRKLASELGVSEHQARELLRVVMA